MTRAKATVTGIAAAIAISVGVIKPWEGRSLVPYHDIVGVLTWCDGETKGQPKAVYTHAECDLITEREVARYEADIRPCLPADLPPKTRAAFISAAYNIGTGAFCGSSMARLAKAGNLRAACDALLRWNRAGGREVRGLTNRRTAERRLCLEGLQ